MREVVAVGTPSAVRRDRSLRDRGGREEMIDLTLDWLMVLALSDDEIIEC